MTYLDKSKTPACTLGFLYFKQGKQKQVDNSDVTTPLVLEQQTLEEDDEGEEEDWEMEAGTDGRENFHLSPLLRGIVGICEPKPLLPN